MNLNRDVNFGTRATPSLASYSESEDNDTRSVHSTAPSFRPQTPRDTLKPVSNGKALGEVHESRTSASEPIPPVPSPHTSTAVPTAYGTITCADDVIRYLIRRGGWAPWRDLIAEFHIGGDYSEMLQWLRDRRQTDDSFCSQNSDWIHLVTYGHFTKLKRADEVLIRFVSLFFIK